MRLEKKKNYEMILSRRTVETVTINTNRGYVCKNDTASIPELFVISGINSASQTHD